MEIFYRSVCMILVRNIFQVKFGQARDAVAAWKKGLAIAERLGKGQGRYRLLTDLAGPDFYTLVLEGTYESLTEVEQTGQALMGSPEWQAWYSQIVWPRWGCGRRVL